MINFDNLRIGDVVQIKSDLDDNRYRGGLYITENMLLLSGNTVKVTYIDYNNKQFKVDAIDGVSWSPSMVREVSKSVVDDPQKMVDLYAFYKDSRNIDIEFISEFEQVIWFDGVEILTNNGLTIGEVFTYVNMLDIKVTRIK